MCSTVRVPVAASTLCSSVGERLEARLWSRERSWFPTRGDAPKLATAQSPATKNNCNLLGLYMTLQAMLLRGPSIFEGRSMIDNDRHIQKMQGGHKIASEPSIIFQACLSRLELCEICLWVLPTLTLQFRQLQEIFARPWPQSRFDNHMDREDRYQCLWKNLMKLKQYTCHLRDVEINETGTKRGVNELLTVTFLLTG